MIALSRELMGGESIPFHRRKRCKTIFADLPKAAVHDGEARTSSGRPPERGVWVGRPKQRSGMTQAGPPWRTRSWRTSTLKSRPEDQFPFALLTYEHRLGMGSANLPALQEPPDLMTSVMGKLG
jgi:hypothetical protein